MSKPFRISSYKGIIIMQCLYSNSSLVSSRSVSEDLFKLALNLRKTSQKNLPRQSFFRNIFLRFVFSHRNKLSLEHTVIACFNKQIRPDFQLSGHIALKLSKIPEFVGFLQIHVSKPLPIL